MRSAERFWIAGLVSCCFLYGATPEIETSLAHGSATEAATRDQLQRILREYDLSGWLWTRKILIDEDAIPHSHPVLTLHTRHLKDDLLLLSTFVHEEYHWYETEHAGNTSAAMAELKTMYPRIPVGGREGASDEESSYLHIIVCYVEWQKMKSLTGSEKAHQVMDYWARDHYQAIYRLVLDNDTAIGDVVRRRQLLPRL